MTLDIIGNLLLVLAIFSAGIIFIVVNVNYTGDNSEDKTTKASRENFQENEEDS